MERVVTVSAILVLWFHSATSTYKRDHSSISTSFLPTKVNTLAFFDLETTGLIEEGEPAPRIIEFSIISIRPTDFLQSIEETPNEMGTGQVQSKVHPDYITPHNTNILSDLIDPQMDIPEKVTNLTGIKTSDVKGQSTFTEFAPKMWEFLNHQPQPIVLIAHYGDGMDFPILVNELKIANSLHGGGPETRVYVADSIKIFRNIDKKWQNKNRFSLSTAPGKDKIQKYHTNIALKNERPSYALKNLHKRLFDEKDPPGHHGALADCTSLMQVAAQYGQDFVNEISTVMKPLQEVPTVEEVAKQANSWKKARTKV